MGAAMFLTLFTEFSGVVLSSFTLSRSNIFTDALLIKPEVMVNPLFKVIFIYFLFSVIGQATCE